MKSSLDSRCKKELKVASLFCGCGGSDLGLLGGFDYLGKHYKRNGYKIVYANEIDIKISEVHNANFGIAVDVRDIRDVDAEGIPEHDVLIGGFPCQSFSIVAQNPKRLGYEDEKGRLFFEVCRVLKKKQPKAFILENVKGLLSANKGQAFPLILNELANCGYNVVFKVLNAADYGVPQRRERVFIVGFRLDQKNEYSYPNPTNNEGDDLFLKPYATLGTVLLDSSMVPEKYYFSDKAVSGMQKAKKEMNKGRVQNPNKVCNTVGSHLCKVSLNSTDPVLLVDGRYRRFTPREVARIQSFPDSYKLVGSDATQYKSLGNAIPPVLMWHVSRKLHECLVGSSNTLEGQGS